MRYKCLLTLGLMLAFCNVSVSQTHSPDYRFAERAFHGLPLEEQRELHVLLIASGHHRSWVFDQFGTRLYEAIRSYKRANRFLPDGVIKRNEFDLLRQQTDPLLLRLNMTEFSRPALPSASLHVPMADTERAPTSAGVSFRARDGAFRVNFAFVPGTTVDRFYLSSRNPHQTTVTYEFKDDAFFVISGDQSGERFYRYYRRGGDAVVGFTYYWKPVLPQTSKTTSHSWR